MHGHTLLVTAILALLAPALASPVPLYDLDPRDINPPKPRRASVETAAEFSIRFAPDNVCASSQGPTTTYNLSSTGCRAVRGKAFGSMQISLGDVAEGRTCRAHVYATERCETEIGVGEATGSGAWFCLGPGLGQARGWSVECTREV